MNKLRVSVVGAGTMGTGIAQVAASAGHSVVLYDFALAALEKGKQIMFAGLEKLLEKQKISKVQFNSIKENIVFTNELSGLKDSEIIIEAIKEDLEIKADLFTKIEELVSDECILATNTSSLSITSIAGRLKIPQRMIGIHFFNPAPIMRLVEIIPALQSQPEVVDKAQNLIEAWGKATVRAKDIPGFIVNRIARPFYSESIRILEEKIASMEEIDFALMAVGGFRMGPFQLMDLIGNDINYAVTESVWSANYFEPRYKPSMTQKQLINAGYLGKKSGRGYYDYTTDKANEHVLEKKEIHEIIANRVIIMLINEAVDGWYYGVASEQDIDKAMTLGVNYPKGLIQWSKEIGIKTCISRMNLLYNTYQEDRYRCSQGFMKLLSEHQ